MEGFVSKVVRFLLAEDGPTAVEYAMALLLILLACLTAITVVGELIANSYESSYESIDQAVQAGP